MTLLQRAMSAAQAAGDLLLHERPADLAVASKSTATDAVTAMDRASEDLLVDLLLAEGPTDAVLGEEGGARHGDSGVRWIIDPLDGTVNYLYGIPEWAVSIAAYVDGTPAVGVVLSPALQTVWWAEAGQGAWRRGPAEAAQRIEVGAESRLGHALTGTGFGYSAQRRRWQAALLGQVIGHIRDIRRAGAAAVDLCRVADGTLDAYFEKGLQPWDLAAGALIVTEAGGVVQGWEGTPADGEMTMAANRALAPELAGLLQSARGAVAAQGIDES